MSRATLASVTHDFRDWIRQAAPIINRIAPRLDTMEQDIAGKADAAHTHAIADIDGLQAIIDDFEARITALENP